jgi:NitT/TauT family transport system ATP-binding protein
VRSKPHTTNVRGITNSLKGAAIPSPEGAALSQISEDTLRPHVTVRGLTKRFGESHVYDGFDLDIPRGEFVSIFGPNGCGKSTLINMIAGLVPADAGEVLFDGRPIREIPFGYVFQNYREALFPWLHALDNIEYPLRLMKLTRRERRERVERLIAHLGVNLDFKRYPYELSGGQQQLVSIMRALVVEPEILFLDEPFSALDYEMTLFMRERLQKIFMKLKTTMLLVSHDLEEAIQLADKVVLLTRRPTKVAEIVDVDLPWPRNLDVTTGQAFISLKRHCLERFQREVKMR